MLCMLLPSPLDGGSISWHLSRLLTPPQGSGMAGSVHLERLLGLGAVLLGGIAIIVCVCAGALPCMGLIGSCCTEAEVCQRPTLTICMMRASICCSFGAVGCVSSGELAVELLNRMQCAHDTVKVPPLPGWYLAWASSLRDIQFFQELLGGGQRFVSVYDCGRTASRPPLRRMNRAPLKLLQPAGTSRTCCRRKAKSGPTAAELQAEIAAIKVWCRDCLASVTLPTLPADRNLLTWTVCRHQQTGGYTTFQALQGQAAGRGLQHLAGCHMTWQMCVQAAHRRGGASGLYARSERRPSREENGHRRHSRESSGRRPTQEQHDGHAGEGSTSPNSRQHGWRPDGTGPSTIHVRASQNARCGSQATGCWQLPLPVTGDATTS